MFYQLFNEKSNIFWGTSKINGGGLTGRKMVLYKKKFTVINVLALDFQLSKAQS